MRGLAALPLILSLLVGCKDSDRDGVRDSLDCAETDPLISPDAVEVCDGIDNNCNGQIDEDVAFVAYWDIDGDGFGDSSKARRVCEMPRDGVDIPGDCDDRNPEINPDAEELCDGIDNNCDEQLDEGVQTTFYEDADGDGHGTNAATIEACYAPLGYALAADDCDDANEFAWTDNPETCDGIDNNCNGTIDEDAPDELRWEDNDGDGFGDPAAPTLGCGVEPGIADNDYDCDDTDASVSPAAIELRGNEEDEDCDAYIDELGVGPGNEFATFEEAQSEAAEGEVVQFDDGFHQVNIEVDKDIVVAGEGCGRTVLYGDSQGSVVRATTGRIERLTLSGGNGSLHDGLGADFEHGGGLFVDGDVEADQICADSNSAYRGGGIAVMSGHLELTNSTANDNSTDSRGPGILVYSNATANIRNSRVFNNITLDGVSGGGITFLGGSGEVTNTVIAGNYCFVRGCGAYLIEGVDNVAEQPADPDLWTYVEPEVSFKNVTFYGNYGSDNYSGPPEGRAFRAEHGLATFENVLFANNGWEEVTGRNGSGDIEFISAGFSNNEGPDEELKIYSENRLAGDALFLSADLTKPTSEWDFRLADGSFGIDVGTGTEVDPDGSPIDIGAYGGPEASDGWNYGWTADDDNDGMLDGYERLHGLLTYLDDSADDPDGDGLDNGGEAAAGTSPNLADTDGDGVDDATELDDGFDPLVWADQGPRADAGADRVVWALESAALSSELSWDPNADNLTFEWSIDDTPGGSVLTSVADPTAPETTFVPDVEGDFVFRLTVSDGKTTSEDVVRLRSTYGLIVPDDVATIAEAIEQVNAGGGIGIQPGYYQEALNLGGKDVVLFGFGDGPGDVVIDAAGIDRVLTAEAGELVTVSNLTLTGGDALHGGGIYTSGSPDFSLIDVVVSNNRATNEGGGIYSDASELNATDLVVINNSAEEGGGLYVTGNGYEAILTMQGGLIARNEAAESGGGLHMEADTSDSFLHAVVFDENSAPEGGALYQTGSSHDLNGEHLTFVRNDGESIIFGDVARTKMHSAVFAYNTATYLFDGNGRYVQHGTVWWANLWSTPFSDSVDAPNNTQTGLIGDPKFAVVSDDGDPLNDLWVPRLGSSLIDNGFVEDFDNDTDRTRSDAGVCGGPTGNATCSRFSSDVDGDNMSDGWELLVGLDPLVDDGADDLDSDGLTNVEEHDAGTSPSLADSDYDGVDDADELAAGTNPIEPGDNRPVLVPGGPYSGYVNIDEVVIDGASASDPNDDALTWNWELSRVPAGSGLTTADVNNTSTSAPSFMPDIHGVFELTGTVNDGQADSRAEVAVVYGLGFLDVPSDYPTVDDAIAASFDGDIVRLGPGDWDLRLEVTENLALVGTSAEDTTLVGDGRGAIFDVSDGAVLTLADLTIANSLGEDGGAIVCNDSELGLERVYFEQNRAYRGGAIWADDCITTIWDSTFDNNGTTNTGGAIYTALGELNVERTRFTRNAASQGGAIYSYGTTTKLEASIFDHNSANSTGGAIWFGANLVGDGEFTSQHNTVVGNEGSLGAIYRSSLIPTDISETLFVGNEGVGYYDNEGEVSVDVHHNGFFQNGGTTDPVVLAVGPNNPKKDPKFLAYDADGDGTFDDYRLQGSSPMIDSGANASPSDPDGTRADIGAFGGEKAHADWDIGQVDSDLDGIPDFWEDLYGLDPAADDSGIDTDGDGLDALTEYAESIAPDNRDSDFDGVDDDVELSNGDNPRDPSDHAPDADAGLDRQAFMGVEESIFGAGIDPDGTAMQYAWELAEQPGRSTLSLAGATGPVLPFTADAAGTYVVRLVVTDADGGVGTDEVRIEVAGEVWVPEDYASVAKAVSSIVSGNTVRIGAGTWPTNADLGGKDVSLIGAGVGQTILDGEWAGPVLTATNGEVLSLEGLTVTGGLGTFGGGLRLESNAAATLLDVYVENNFAVVGGGFYADSSDIMGLSVRLVDNLASFQGGGGNADDDCVLEFEQILIAGNEAVTDYGGGIRNSDSDLTLTNAVISDNKAERGGGLYGASNATFVLNHITATYNDAPFYGSFLGTFTSDIELHDSVVTGNTGTDAVYASLGTVKTYNQTYSLFVDNPEGNYGSLADPPLHAVDGNDIDHLEAVFANVSDDGDWTNDIWTLEPGSPGFDLGDPAGELDPDGSAPNMGAFGGALGDWTP